MDIHTIQLNKLKRNTTGVDNNKQKTVHELISPPVYLHYISTCRMNVCTNKISLEIKRKINKHFKKPRLIVQRKMTTSYTKAVKRYIRNQGFNLTPAKLNRVILRARANLLVEVRMLNNVLERALNRGNHAIVIITRLSIEKFLREFYQLTDIHFGWLNTRGLAY
jgi:hypothetical protein